MRADWLEAGCLLDLERGLSLLRIFPRHGYCARLFGSAELLLRAPLFLWDSEVAAEEEVVLVAGAESAPVEARGVQAAVVAERAAAPVVAQRVAGPAAGVRAAQAVERAAVRAAARAEAQAVAGAAARVAVAAGGAQFQANLMH